MYMYCTLYMYMYIIHEQYLFSTASESEALVDQKVNGNTSEEDEDDEHEENGKDAKENVYM